jgi:hypothetical protein
MAVGGGGGGGGGWIGSQFMLTKENIKTIFSRNACLLLQ